MSRSNKAERAFFLKNESAWADFFITRIGLILFASILLLASFKIYPMFQEQESRSYLDTIASDMVSRIEAVDSTTVPGYRYNYVFEKDSRNVKIEISTEYIIAHGNLSTGMWKERELIHAEPLITYIYPPNSNWDNSSGFRKFVSETIGDGKNGDASSPLEFSGDKEKVEKIFQSIRKELANDPFIPDQNKPLFIEKVIMYYSNGTEILKRDYVFIYQ